MEQENNCFSNPKQPAGSKVPAGRFFVETQNCLKENMALVKNYLGKSISI